MSDHQQHCWWVDVAPGLICRTHAADSAADDRSCTLECVDMSQSDWCCALGGGREREARWSSGRQEYRLRIDSACVENMYVGVARTSHAIDAHICGETFTSWSIYPLDGDVQHGSKSYRFWNAKSSSSSSPAVADAVAAQSDRDADKPIRQGDTVRVVVDFDAGHIYFAVNDAPPRLAFTGVDTSQPLVPCVTLALNRLAVTCVQSN